MISLRPYQRDAVNAVYRHLREHDDNPCVVIPTAGGKTNVTSTICKDAVNLWGGRVLVLAHVKELLEQAVEKLQHAAPELMLNIGIHSAGLGCRDTEHAIIVAGIQSVHKRAKDLGRFDLVIVDECFPAGTMIETPKGIIPIETVQPGNLIHNAIGYGEVLATSVRPAWEIVKVEFSDGSILKCTPEHPIFTENGWVKADSLELGAMVLSRETLCRLWSDISAVEQIQKWADDYHEGEALDSTAMLLKILLQEIRKPDVERMFTDEDAGNLEPNSPSTKRARWKRSITSSSAVGIAECIGRRLGSGAYHSHESAARDGLANAFQAGSGEPGGAVRNRDRWSKSCVHRTEGPGSKENDLSCGKRVVRITHHKLESACPVFNLHVSGHPTYFAGGVLVHNCHMIPPEGEGVYRSLLNDLKAINPALRVIGLTATPYRLAAGSICSPANILNSICYEVGIRELIVQGFLCPLITKAGKQKADTKKLRTRAGEFIASEVETLMDDDALVRSACSEIIEQTRDRHSVLIFASGIKHGEHVRQTIEHLGAGCRTIYGDTLEFERAQTLEDFKNGRVKYLVNVNVLTTGFDAPNIDCVVLLRPTLSPGLWYQCCGRGFRLHASKKDCLVLDFGGNAIRHGPVDALKVKKPGAGGGEPPAKECPGCQAVIAAGYTVCPHCGQPFERVQNKHEAQAGTAGVISGQKTEVTYEVQEVLYGVHVKRGASAAAPRSLRVDYRLGFSRWQSEWICLEHSGFARQRAESWWQKRSSAPIPQNVEAAVEIGQAGGLRTPRTITIQSIAGEKFDRIIAYEFPKNDDECWREVPEPEYAPAMDDIPF